MTPGFSSEYLPVAGKRWKKVVHCYPKNFSYSLDIRNATNKHRELLTEREREREGE